MVLGAGPSDLFDAALVDGYWSAERIKQVAADEMAKRRLDLEAEFLFLDQRVFWFTSTATTSAWSDFYYFALGYHYLPKEFKADLRALRSHRPRHALVRRCRGA